MINDKNNNYNTSAHLTYLCRYHVVFCPKYRRKILTDGKDVRLKEVFTETARAHNFEILEMEVMPDHVHVFVDVPQTAASCDVVRTFKDISAIELFKAFPQLIQFCRMRYFMV